MNIFQFQPTSIFAKGVEFSEYVQTNKFSKDNSDQLIFIYCFFPSRPFWKNILYNIKKAEQIDEIWWLSSTKRFASASEDIKIKFICKFSHNKNYTQGLSYVSGNERKRTETLFLNYYYNKRFFSYPFSWSIFSGPLSWYVALAPTKVGPFMEIKIMSRRHMHCYPFQRLCSSRQNVRNYEVLAPGPQVIIIITQYKVSEYMGVTALMSVLRKWTCYMKLIISA